MHPVTGKTLCQSLKERKHVNFGKQLRRQRSPVQLLQHYTWMESITSAKMLPFCVDEIKFRKNTKKLACLFLKINLEIT